ncbi:hypothetical protein Tco_1566552, partial [Tanacetum coccineum]
MPRHGGPYSAARAKEEEVRKLEQEVKSLRAANAEVQGLRNQTKNLETLLEAEQVSTLQAQIIGEERIKAAFKDFKRLEDEKVEQRCTKMDARLDALSINFDEELYPHMLTAISGRRWVIGHGLRLAVMKCTESTELRQAFADVVSTGIVKGRGEIHRSLYCLKDMKYPLVDQLEQLKDAPIDLLITSLHLESDTGEDALPFICDLRPSSSQLKIHVYPEVRDLKDLWAVKEEMLLEDAVATNISRAEKKKKCQIVCRTHGVGSAHHARSDGVP